MTYDLARYNGYMKRKVFDFLVLVGLALFASAMSLIWQLTFLYSTILFLGLPCLFLALRLRHTSQSKRIIVMALLFGGWYGFLLAYIADWNRIWAWPPESLPWGLWFYLVNPVEILWVFLWVLFIVLFYEHFVEHDTKKIISGRIIWAILPASFITLAITLMTIYYPWALSWPYAYAVLLILTLPPAIILLWRNPHILGKILLPSLFFIPFHVAHEIVSVSLGHWYFPGQYFALVPLPGNTLVPLEETIVWIILGSVLVLAYYELYVDDGK